MIAASHVPPATIASIAHEIADMLEAQRITRAGVATIRPLEARDIESLSVLVAVAFADRHGGIPEPYRPGAVRERLQWSLDSAQHGGPRTLVADIDDLPAGMAQFARARWAQNTWELMLGAVWPEMQGKGIGHALTLARLSAIAKEGGGLVLVSAKKPERWLRYGFAALALNTTTGATMLAREITGERA